MQNNLIDQRLKQYTITTLEDEENALKEILQEIALYALSTTDFFNHALFHRETSLRILHHLPRFSEDLDFVLKTPNKAFQWDTYKNEITKIFKLYGIEPDIQDRSRTNTAIQKLFLKDNSIGKIINLNFHHHSHRKLLIKFEIDTNPPAGSNEKIMFLDFPIDYAISTQDLSSNFSGKCHALLCRPYVKGRDWFDFSWYIAQNVTPNLELLSNALKQTGPWQNQDIEVNAKWLRSALESRIKTINWSKASLEVQRFVGPEHSTSLKLWEIDFFMDKVDKLTKLMA